jgi:hypothetical protein
MGLSEKDGGGSYVGDLIYATGLYRYVTPSTRFHFLHDAVRLRPLAPPKPV